MRMLRLMAVLVLLGVTVAAQTPTSSPTPPLLKPDERLKVDVLLIVAHPDDETGVVPYLVQYGAGTGGIAGRGAGDGVAARAG
jgi:predicted metal-dependent RNase